MSVFIFYFILCLPLNINENVHVFAKNTQVNKDTVLKSRDTELGGA